MIFKRKTDNDYDEFKKLASGKVSKPKVSKKQNPILRKLTSPFRFIGRSKLIKGVTSTLGNKEILKKISVTVLVVLIYRVLATIPLPGVDLRIFREVFGSATASETSYLFTIFTGGRLDTPSIVGLGLAAYINASIIMQLLPYAISRLKELQKEGERGRQIINQITRFITFPLSFIYSIAYLLLLSRQDLSQTITTLPAGSYLIPHAPGVDYPSAARIILMALVLAAGTIFLMWLSEFITEKGLGNGSSVIISVGILASLPTLLQQDLAAVNFQQVFADLLQGSVVALTNPFTLSLILILFGFVLVIAAIVFVNESQRKVPIQYARRIRGNEGGQGSFLPVKFTITGVMPVIFAFTLISVPQLLIPIIETSSGPTPFTESIKESFLYASADQIVDSKDTVYAIVNFLLVIVFGIFYSFIVLNPKETSENLQKSGAFIPGIRPGRSTERYITNVILRIALVGSIFLAIIALIPIVGRNIVFQSTGNYLQILSGIGGTSILIIVGVLLDTLRQYQSLVATRSYEKYLR